MSENGKNTSGNKCWLESDIVHYNIVAPVDEEEGLRLYNCGRKAIENGDATLIAIDLQESPRQFSSGARKVWVQLLQNPKVHKTAIFGGSVFVRTVASFVIAAAGRKNIRFFLTKKEALAWLKNSQNETFFTGNKS